MQMLHSWAGHHGFHKKSDIRNKQVSSRAPASAPASSYKSCLSSCFDFSFDDEQQYENVFQINLPFPSCFGPVVSYQQ